MKRALVVAALALAGCGGHRAAPQLKEPNAGDEHPIRVRVKVVVTAAAVTVRPGTVAAFLPLRFTVVGAAAVRMRGRSVTSGLTSPGLKAGRYPIRAGRGRSATLVVKPGG